MKIFRPVVFYDHFSIGCNTSRYHLSSWKDVFCVNAKGHVRVKFATSLYATRKMAERSPQLKKPTQPFAKCHRTKPPFGLIKSHW